MWADRRSRDRGDPFDKSAGGVARERDLNKFWNRPGFRTINRAWGAYNLVGGTYASAASLGDDIREGNWFAAGLNSSGFAAGALEIGGTLAGSSTLLAAGRWLGAPGTVISSGVIGWRIGTNLYTNYVDKENAMDAGSWVEEHAVPRAGRHGSGGLGGRQRGLPHTGSGHRLRQGDLDGRSRRNRLEPHPQAMEMAIAIQTCST